MKKSIQELLDYEERLLEERLMNLDLFEKDKSLLNAYEFLNKMADSFTLASIKVAGLDRKISDFDKGSAVAYSLCVDLLKPIIENSCHVVLYANDFKEDVWASYMQILGENENRKTVKLDIVKPVVPLFKKIPFKVGDKVIIRDGGRIVKVSKVLNDGGRYLIDDDYLGDGNPNEEYFFGDLVKF